MLVAATWVLNSTEMEHQNTRLSGSKYYYGVRKLRVSSHQEAMSHLYSHPDPLCSRCLLVVWLYRSSDTAFIAAGMYESGSNV